MSTPFPQESSEAFLNLKRLHYAEQRKLHQRVLTEYFEKRHGFIWLLTKETFWHSPTSFVQAFITKCLEKQFKGSPWQSTPNLSLHKLRAAVSLVPTHFLLNSVGL